MIWLLGYVVGSWLLADFLSGVIHWAEDRYAREDWPVIGPLVAKPNILHHSQPQVFLEGSYWHRNYTTIIPAMAAMLVCLAIPPLQPLWLVCLFLTQANEVHAWAHQLSKVNWLIELAQETGVLQSPRHHAEHHRSPHLVRYCVLSNWLNPWLDHFQFWTRLENLLADFFIRPRESD